MSGVSPPAPRAAAGGRREPLHLVLLTVGLDAALRQALAASVARRMADDTGMPVRYHASGVPTTAFFPREPVTATPSAADGVEPQPSVLITAVDAEDADTGTDGTDTAPRTRAIEGAETAPGPLHRIPQDADHLWVVRAVEPAGCPLEDALLRTRLPWSRLPLGTGPDAVRDAAGRAVASVASLLRPRAAAGAGLFTRLAERNARYAAWRWTCDNCDDPDCEHALRATASPPGDQLTAREPGG